MATSKKAAKKGSAKRTTKKVGKGKKAASKPIARKQADNDAARTRTARPYPASSFTDALTLGEAIMRFASGDRVRRLTLLQQMNKSPTSGPTKQMITNSGKYGITSGSYAAEYLELTEKGRLVVDSSRPDQERKRASFELAVEGVAPFKVLYDHYKDKRLPEREIMKDVIGDSAIDVPDLDECVDTFTVNVKDLDMLRTIGGAETLVSIEQVVEELGRHGGGEGAAQGSSLQAAKPPQIVKNLNDNQGKSTDWGQVCFYITPIGAEDSVERRHADLFMSSLVQPALEELGLTVVRADHIGEPGMITTQILEYLKKSRLAIADLSYLNPNVFYEVALRHALRLPVVQIIRKSDRLPFDVNQARTLVFDTSDIYSLVPKLQTYRAEIATQARKALEDPESVGNPVSIFYPDFYD
ncbi:hypothetical protein [Stenotrophomonas sp. BIGb0135]|uniref:hypothetical protein n=1 Tax=Stenotrophomonas sp. BIGb0135 TaxID=2940620 RepID=UPI002168D36D|nr:hypothetical protein [Stenotrophomonas sp. BIGb0135]MCS4236810.1 hypothetical protein [Stenotrophomonas sp. BIGb0135]